MTVELSNFGKVTASKAMLNHLSVVLREASFYNESIGCYGCAKELAKDSNIVFNALDAQGYYDNVRED